MERIKTEFETQVSMETESIPSPDDPPFHILFLGDFSGRENLAAVTDAPLVNSKPVEIDRDNFDDVLRNFNTSLRLKLEGVSEEPILLGFNEFEDFHPDKIFERVSVFADLRDVRRRLLNDVTYEQAAQEVRGWFEKAEPNVTVSAEESIVSEDNTSSSTGNLLEDILEQKSVGSAEYRESAPVSGELGSFVRSIVKPYLVETDFGAQAELLKIVDEAVSGLMKRLLNHTDFKALEAAWRGLYFLVKNAQTNRDLKIFVLDVTKHEVCDKLKNIKELDYSEMFRMFDSELAASSNGAPWSLLCANYEFELNVEDVAGLMRLAKIGSYCDAPFIASVKPQMLGIEALGISPDYLKWNYTDETAEGKLWTMLRTIPEAMYLGLVLPRILARYPYGAQTEPTELFEFEEFDDVFEHEDYLWFNPSFAIALLFAETFSVSGWEMKGKMLNELEGLPVHIYENDGETIIKPTTEIVISESALNILVEQGLMVLLTLSKTDKVRLPYFQSVAFPERSLKGRWG
ncbi:MAG: type VI secretion system contractile sheath domain-containing protein [Pyrinomonadaceae bacterium]